MRKRKKEARKGQRRVASGEWERRSSAATLSVRLLAVQSPQSPTFCTKREITFECSRRAAVLEQLRAITWDARAETFKPARPFLSRKKRRASSLLSLSRLRASSKAEKSETGICSPARPFGLFQVFPLSRSDMICVYDLRPAGREERKARLGREQRRETAARASALSLFSFSLFPFSRPSLQLPSSSLSQTTACPRSRRITL